MMPRSRPPAAHLVPRSSGFIDSSHDTKNASASRCTMVGRADMTGQPKETARREKSRQRADSENAEGHHQSRGFLGVARDDGLAVSRLDHPPLSLAISQAGDRHGQRDAAGFTGRKGYAG